MRIKMNCLGWTTMTTAFLAMFCFVTGAFGANPENLDDNDITLAVEGVLLGDDAVPAHKIDVNTENGIVTLSGSVYTYRAKIEAEREASAVKGVLAAANNIEVEPIVRSDRQIQSDILAALAIDPVADSFEIEANVEKGWVTLEGTVDSYSELIVAENVAEDVKGVVGVSNLLTYEIDSDRTDADIRGDVKQRLKADAAIDSDKVTVTVADGKVTLKGTVSSALEKTQAVNEAWLVPGVSSVVNKIDVEWLASDTSDWDESWNDAQAR